MSQAVWLSWENHRRSREMSRALDIPFRVIGTPKGKLWRILYPALPFIKSIFILLGTDAKTVVVQNPSLLLTTLACLIKPIKRYYLIQDLHSYFHFYLYDAPGFRNKVYKYLSRFCLKVADLTVVTNPELKAEIEAIGARGYVLQDPIPVFPEVAGSAPGDERKIVFICTYADDEPLDEVFKAAKLLNGEATFYVTGRIPRWMKTWQVPSNVKLTDFLPEKDYLRLLKDADGILGLTIREHTLLCGAYEGLAFRKPLVLSNMAALKNYFGEGVIYVENEAGSIADGIRRLLSAKPFYERQIANTAHDLEQAWPRTFERFNEAVRTSAPPPAA